MKSEITASIKLKGGKRFCRKNMEQIVARATKPTDPWGNALPSPIERFRICPPYLREWRVKKEPKGFIFREVGNNSGICGHHKNLRSLVISTLRSGIQVELEEGL